MESQFAKEIKIIVILAACYLWDTANMLQAFSTTPQSLYLSPAVMKVFLSGIWRRALVSSRLCMLNLFILYSETTCKDAHEGHVECLAWLYDGSILLSGGKDATVKIWKVDETYC